MDNGPQLIERHHHTDRVPLHGRQSGSNLTANPPDVPFAVVNDVVSSLLQQRKYDRHAAYLLSVAAGWAYSDENALTMLMAKCGMRDAKVTLARIANPAMLVDVDAYVIVGSRIGILCFRGTEFGTATFTDVLTDADVEFTRSFMNDGSVHRGFYRSVLYIWDYVDKSMRESFGASDGSLAPSQIDSLYITGHSLGGALAVLAGERICKDHKYAALKDKLKGVYTYGQPMVGDAEYNASCAKSDLADMLYRHVYGRDWVPTLPPWTTGSFDHFGQLYVSTPTGWKPSTVKPVRALTAFLSGAIATATFAASRFRIPRAVIKRLGVNFSLEDHLPGYYIEASRFAEVDEFP